MGCILIKLNVTLRNYMTYVMSLAHMLITESVTSDFTAAGSLVDGSDENPTREVNFVCGSLVEQKSTCAVKALVPSLDFHFSTELHFSHFPNGTAALSSENVSILHFFPCFIQVLNVHSSLCPPIFVYPFFSILTVNYEKRLFYIAKNQHYSPYHHQLVMFTVNRLTESFSVNRLVN